jgi:hypothetical protein
MEWNLVSRALITPRKELGIWLSCSASKQYPTKNSRCCGERSNHVAEEPPAVPLTKANATQSIGTIVQVVPFGSSVVRQFRDKYSKRTEAWLGDKICVLATLASCRLTLSRRESTRQRVHQNPRSDNRLPSVS